jgi:hypothetical protein
MTERIAAKRGIGFFTLFFIIAFPAISHALCEATLEWDPTNSGAKGYYVFGREAGQDYDYDDPWWQGDHTFSSCTFEDLDEDKTYFFVVRAYSDDAVSEDSNEVRYSYESIQSDGDSSSLSNGAGSDGSSASFYGSSSGCFLNSILGSD